MDSQVNGEVEQPPAAGVTGKSSESLSETAKMEQQLLRVPLEHLKKCIRTTSRLVDRDVGAVLAGVSDSVRKDLTREEAVEQLDRLMSRLQGLKRKLDESNKAEQDQAQRCRTRIEHLGLMDVGLKEDPQRWNKMRLDRLLIDYMLRSSYYQSALKLAEQTQLQDLVDIDIFMDAHKVIQALRQKDCSEALAWCGVNKAKLKKNKSTLELKLRVQEFIELVRDERMLDAILYARKHLAPWGATNMKELQQAMATLAFKSTTDCPPYKTLFDEKQWESLARQFEEEFVQLYGMSTQSLLHIHLQAGLSALKTPFSYEEGCTKEDPLSQEAFRKLAEPLPFAKHISSKLVCRITKERMDDHNPPLVLPNGYVYSRKAMEEMAKKNHGKICCPRSGATFNFDQLVKAYVF